MSAARSTGALVLALWAAACTGNEAPGNDREAALSPPEPAAEVPDVGAAITGVAPALLHPGTMTDADLGSLPGQGLRCLYRFTRVGLPVLAYGGASAVIESSGAWTAGSTASGSSTPSTAPGSSSGSSRRRSPAGRNST